jgi:alpha-beta hydrolase superfamily lysophospholipase
MSLKNTKTKIASAFAAVTMAISLPVSSIAHDLQPASMPNSTSEVTANSINEHGQSVLIAWTVAQPTAILIAVHGFGLHKGAYKQFAEQMQQDRVSTYALDVRGFGGWMQPGKNSAVSFGKTMQDLRTLVRSIREEHPTTPIFVLGESMGGAIALSFAAADPNMIDGVISAVPSYERFHPLRTAARIAVSYILGGGGKISLNNVMVDRATKDKQVRTTWESDSQAKLRVSLRDLLRFNSFMKASSNTSREIKRLPVLIVQGHKDELVKPAGTEKLYDELTTKDKQMLERANGEHLTFEEGQFDQSTLTTVQRWLTQHEQPAVIASNL